MLLVIFYGIAMWFFLLPVLLLVGCLSGGKSSVKDDSGDSFSIVDGRPESNCNSIFIESVERHPEQDSFYGALMQPLSVGLLLTDTDDFDDSILSARQFRLETVAEKEVTGLDVQVTGLWPSGNSKWLWLRWNGRMRVAEDGYTFF